MKPPLPCSDLLDACSSVVYVAELDGTVVWAGGPTGALGVEVGQPLAVFDLDRPRVASAREGTELDLAYRVERPGGELVWLADAARRVEVDGSPRLIGTWRDRSQVRLAAREALSLARLEARAELAGSMAHEVNNPLAGVLNYSELARRLPNPDARYDEALTAISSEAARIRGITEGLRTLPQRAAGAGTYSLDPQHLLRGLIAPIRRTLREQMVNLEVNAESGLLPARSVGLALQGALRELLDNAFHACLRVEQRRLELGARVDEVGDDLRVVFTVADSGQGLTPDQVSRAGSAFYSTREGADGLGLTLVERWAAELGGTFSLGEAPGGGCLAELAVPVA